MANTAIKVRMANTYMDWQDFTYSWSTDCDIDHELTAGMSKIGEIGGKNVT